MQHPCEVPNLELSFPTNAPYHGRAVATRTRERRKHAERVAIAHGQTRFRGSPEWDYGQQDFADVWRVRRIRRKPRPRPHPPVR